MNENIDKILEKYNEDVKRHMTVLTEDFKDQVKIIAEQYESIDKRLSSVERNTEVIKIDIAFIKSSLKQKVDLEEFSVLEKRVALLEAKSNRV